MIGKFILTGALLIITAFVVAQSSPDDSPDWWKLIVGSTLLIGTIMLFISILVGIWTG